MRVMIADDTLCIRMSIREIVEEKGHAVVKEVSTGEEAIMAYKTEKPDLVFMETTMPGMSGIEALKVIKAFDPGAEVIMVSTVGQQAMVIEAIQSGAKDFIVKPFKSERISVVLGRYE